MKAHFSILALVASLAACGHAADDLSLDQTTTALACRSAGGAACKTDDDGTADRHHSAYDDADAGAAGSGACQDGTDCTYTEVCHRHGTECSDDSADAGHHGGDHGTDDAYDSSEPEYGDDHGSSEPEYNDDHGSSEPEYGDDHGSSEPEYGDDHGSDGDRSGSNSGRH